MLYIILCTAVIIAYFAIKWMTYTTFSLYLRIFITFLTPLNHIEHKALNKDSKIH